MAQQKFIILLVFYLLLVWGSQDEKRLLRELFDPNRENPHNRLERPSRDDSKSIILNSTFMVNQIMDVDEKNQVLTSIIWVRNIWYDYHFNWDPSDYGGIKSLNLAPDMIWKPDLLLYNCVDESFDRFHHSNVIVRHDGLVTWYPLGLFRSICSINILWFPFDSQVCDLKFGTWSHVSRQITFRIPCNNGSELCDDEQDIETIKNGEFNVYSITVQRETTKYTCCPDIFETIKVRIYFQRRALYYIFNLALPCMLISGMSLMVFMLPPDAGEKISLGVTILLSLTMFLQLVADKLPQTSESIPLIGIYFSCTMLLCSFSIVFTVLVLSFHHMSRFDDGVPKWVRVYINVYLAKMVFIEPIDFEKTSSQKTDSDMDLIPPPPYPESEEFRVSGIIEKRRTSGNEDSPLRSVSSNSTLNMSDSSKEEPKLDSQSTLPGQKIIEEALCYYKPDLQHLLKELKDITKHIRSEDHEGLCSNQWKFAARVVDRFCLFIFTAANIILIFAVIFSAPNLSRSFIVSK